MSLRVRPHGKQIGEDGLASSLYVGYTPEVEALQRSAKKGEKMETKRGQNIWVKAQNDLLNGP